MSADRWEKSAARENARRTAAAPLLVHAGLVPLTTADEQRTKIERGVREFQERMERAAERSLAQAKKWRAEVAAVVTLQELAALDLDWERALCPKTPEYLASRWHQEKRKRGLCKPSARYPEEYGICNCCEVWEPDRLLAEERP